MFLMGNICFVPVCNGITRHIHRHYKCCKQIHFDTQVVRHLAFTWQCETNHTIFFESLTHASYSPFTVYHFPNLVSIYCYSNQSNCFESIFFFHNFCRFGKPPYSMCGWTAIKLFLFSLNQVLYLVWLCLQDTTRLSKCAPKWFKKVYSQYTMGPNGMQTETK